MAKKRKKGQTQQGRVLTSTQKEMIVQAYALTGNKALVCRQLHLAPATVAKVIKEAETDLTLQKVRVSALEDVAGQVHGKTTEILNSITGEDMESGLIKINNADGTLKSVKAYGPSLMQKVTSAAILTDKLKVIQETKAAITQDHAADPTALPLPGDMQEALKQIGQRVKRLRVLDVQFADHHPELASQVQDAAHKASLNEDIEEADYEELDFDNPVSAGDGMQPDADESAA